MSGAQTTIGHELIDRFRTQSWLDDPFLGPVLPAEFEADSVVWPQRSHWASIELLRRVQAGPREVTELWYEPLDPALERLPVGVVWDTTNHDEPVARVYYNKALVDPAITQTRAPLIAPDPDLALHPTMRAYAEALRVGDGARLREVLAPELRVRAPNGRWLEPEGEESVRDRFTQAMSRGVPLMYVTSTDDGSCAALEFISWRNPPHAGLGIYERDASGLITQFRNYEGPVRRGPLAPADP